MTVMKTKKWTESDVICAALEQRTVREGADWLNENLPEDYRISHSSVYNWTVLVHEPNDEFIRALMTFYPDTDPRFQLGKDLTEMRQAKMRNWIDK